MDVRTHGWHPVPLLLSPQPTLMSTSKISSGQGEQDAGWELMLNHGELDKSGLKQLRWIFTQSNTESSPIRGWSEKLVQGALDQLANEGALRHSPFAMTLP